MSRRCSPIIRFMEILRLYLKNKASVNSPKFRGKSFAKWRRQWQPTPVLLPGKSHGRRSLVGCSPWGHEQSDTTERLHFHFSLSCIGEGTGNPLQCSCLENPRDRGAWWAAIRGVVQSRTRLKQLSSSSSPSLCFLYILPCWFLICLFMLPLMWTFKPKSSLQSFTCLTNGSSPLMALIIMS